MEGFSLKSRAIAFAFCIGAVAFILALLAGGRAGSEGEIAQAVIVAIVCAVMSWGSAERAISSIAESVDSAIERLSQAAHGDLVSPTPQKVSECLPQLADALDGLIAQVRTNLESVHTLAMFDPVTSLANRTNFRRETGRVLRELPDDTMSALLFVDLDRFKAVNDSMGHASGDQLLAKVANRLRAVVTPDAGRGVWFAREPVIGRLAGDEFTIFFPELGNIDEAERMARSVLYALTEPFDLAGHQIEIGASIGVALRPHHGKSLTALMRSADVAMYHAKESGRGQVQFFSHALADRLADNVRLESDLRHALDHGEFALAFQPQIVVATGEVRAAEALLRWNHPLLGERLPESFLGRAEESGLIGEIGEWVVDSAAATIARWHAARLDRRLAFNISARELAHPDFFNRIREAMARHRAPMHLLEIEIHEGLAMQCGDLTIAEFARLRDEGVSITIDDFGTGYSNIGRLKGLPIDRIKLDRSLIAGIVDSEEARTVAHAVIGLVQGLGFKAVAMGVETDEQRDLLRVIGCEAYQGYVAARPMSEAALDKWIDDGGEAATG